MRLNLPKRVLADIRRFGRLFEADLKHFIEAKLNGHQTRRLDKACGYGDDGEIVCQAHINLGLRHYRLGSGPDPILMYQETPDHLWIIEIGKHEDVFFGNGERWCHSRQHLILWDGNEEIREALNAVHGILADEE